MALAWKAGWVHALTSSNLVSSAALTRGNAVWRFDSGWCGPVVVSVLGSLAAGLAPSLGTCADVDKRWGTLPGQISGWRTLQKRVGRSGTYASVYPRPQWNWVGESNVVTPCAVSGRWTFSAPYRVKLRAPHIDSPAVRTHRSMDSQFLVYTDTGASRLQQWAGDRRGRSERLPPPRSRPKLCRHWSDSSAEFPTDFPIADYTDLLGNERRWRIRS